MKLTICYLCVLTLLCAIPITLTSLGLVSRYWIRYSLEKYVPAPPSTNGQVEGLQYLPVKMDIYGSLDKTHYCTKLPQPGAPPICVDITNEAFASLFNLAKQLANSTDEKETASVDLFIQHFHDTQDTLKMIRILTIVGLAVQVGGAILALTFWRRGFQVLVRTRWLLCALCWFAAGIVMMTSTIIAIPLNQETTDNFQTNIDLDRAEKVEKMGGAADSQIPQDRVHVTGYTALAFSGLTFADAFVIGVYVLLARRFRLPAHKYSPISLVTYEKSKTGNKMDAMNLVNGDPDEAASDEEAARLHMRTEYHD